MSSKPLPHQPTLVIFGCGYVGSEIARQALAKGWQVRALTRNPEKAQALRALGLTQVEVADLDSDAWHDKFDRDQDFVLNCVSSAGGGIDGYRKSYIDGQRSILKWAATGHIGTYVYTSATSVYPQADGEWVDETAPTENASETGSLLLESEDLLKGAPGLSRWFALRLGGIYGPNRHYFVDMLKAGKTEFPGSGETWLNLIHRDDIARAVFAAFEAPAQVANRIYNVTDGHPAPRGEIIGWLAQQCGQPEPVFAPDQARSRDSGRRSEAGRMPDRRIDAGLIERELGWKPAYPTYKDGFTEILR
ncbi:NAD-dependent epimerase/dehydratase family protein [Ruficoccus amylovorans]|uniref:NAD-dependent epimerase/dehydratase family protein n=1 Tax=Ruficoccus amylovorans TaxID=1804625 RepID=A0A842HAI7_9BACT|nr:NAD-dependent epimerase/dehydratase family protein [Ruficoccus amylovorans]MBC2593345.1 NAD-dependent epimerase/dehydratase family protein [Ruficoccus amylovorans]